jgi:predicted MFS family arabinose efflux permease
MPAESFARLNRILCEAVPMDRATTAEQQTPLRRNRDFLLLWSGSTVSALGSSMSMLVLPLIGYAITGSTALAGLATAAVLLGGVLARLPAGALVDRWSRGRILLLSNLAGAACYASLAATTLAHRLTLAQLVGVGFLSGVIAAFIDPAASAAVRTVVPESQLPIAYSRNQVRRHAAGLIGPPLGGALYGVARGLPFLLDAVSYAIAALAMARLRTSLPAAANGRRRMFTEIAEGLRFVWHTVVIRAIMLWGAAINFSVSYVLVTVTLRLIRAGVHPSVIGLVDAIAAAAGLLGAFAAPSIIQRMATGRTTIMTGLVLAVIVAPLAWTNSVAVIATLLACGFFLMPANNSGIAAYLAAVTPHRLQGRMFSAGAFIATGIEPAAPALAGVLIAALGGRAATLVGAALVAASLAPLLASDAIRGLGRPDSWVRPADDAELAS